MTGRNGEVEEEKDILTNSISSVSISIEKKILNTFYNSTRIYNKHMTGVLMVGRYFRIYLFLKRDSKK